jgi:hypothetical protein
MTFFPRTSQVRAVINTHTLPLEIAPFLNRGGGMGELGGRRGERGGVGGVVVVSVVSVVSMGFKFRTKEICQV